MPEGDTIFRAAATLHAVLAGQTILGCESPVPSVASARLEGHVVTSVLARGKNLLIQLDDGRVLHSHMRMHGSWHVYRIGERWLRRRESVRVVLTTSTFVVVCFSAPVMRVLGARALAHDAQLATLGPDLLDPACDLERARHNLRLEPSLEIGDALMQQRLVAGIGNVYKSETLFSCRVNPFERVRGLDDSQLNALLGRARTDLKRNTTRGAARVTRVALSGPRAWVYLRARLPCLVCGAAIEMRRQGTVPRSTYYCRRCQSVETAP
jgi:endonuclease-8